MVLGKAIDQGLEKLDAFQVADGIQAGLLEKRKIFLNDIVAKRMESVDIDLIRVRANERQKPAPHRNCPCVGISETKDVAGQGIGIQQDLPDPGGKDLRLARSRSGYDHDRPFRAVYGKTLPLIQSPIFL